MTEPAPRPRKIRPPNDLKAKAGHLNLKARAAAAAQIKPPIMEFDFPGHALPLVSQCRDHVQAGDLKAAFEIAHDLKGQGGSFDYGLITLLFGNIGKLCRLQTKQTKMLHSVILAHLDGADLVLRQALTGDGGDIGTALMKEMDHIRQRLEAA